MKYEETADGRLEARLKALLASRFEDLKFADTKAALLLTAATALAAGAFLLAKDMRPPDAGVTGCLLSNLIWMGRLAPAAAIAGYLCAISSVMCAAIAVQPRYRANAEMELATDDERIRWFVLPKNAFSRHPRENAGAANEHRLLSSSDNGGFKDGSALHDALRAAGDDGFRKAMAEEIHRMALSLHLKHRWVHRAVLLLRYESAFLLAFVLLKFLPVLIGRAGPL